MRVQSTSLTSQLTAIVRQQLAVRFSSSKNTLLIEQMLIQPLLGLLHSSHPIISLQDKLQRTLV